MRSLRILMPRPDRSGRVALLAGVGAAFITGAFAYVHRVVLLDWPAAALDGSGTMLAYLTAGILFQFAVPVLCLAALIFGTPARRLWRARIGLACAAIALLGYMQPLRSCLDVIQ